MIETSTSAASKESTATAPFKHLLIVDDEREFGDYVKTIALEIGFSVTVTENATDFMTSYSKKIPSVIVMDMVMPGIDGVELINWLARQKCTAKIIVVTGFNPRYIELAEDLGGAKGLSKIKTLTKPITPEDMRKALL